MEFNSHTQWRLALAREITAVLRGYSGIRAVVIGGSVARGYADEYSDLELPIFWDALPTDHTRQSIAADLQADFLYPYNGPSLEDNLLIRGFQVDLWHNTVSGEEEVIDNVVHALSLDQGDSNFMDTIRFCIPLYGEVLIEEWKVRARVYPDELAFRKIEQAVNALQADHLSLLARRDNPTLLYGQISDIQKQVFQILLALNRRYFPTYKWIYPTLREMSVKPNEIESRFRRAYTCPQVEAAQDTARIVDETLRLVQDQFPLLDSSVVRNQLKFTRVSHPKPIRLRN